MTTNPEHVLFASTARAFLDREGSLTAVRDLHAADASFAPGWWQRAAELGWTSLLVPEDLGGGSVSGDGVADLVLVAEQIGHTVAPGPLHAVSTVLAGLADAENAHAHSDTIEALVSGDLVASWAVCEPGRAFTPTASTVTATPSGTGLRIDGVKDRVEAGADCGAFLVTVMADGALRQVLVPADAPGVRVQPQQSLDLVKRFALVTFDGVEVAADALVGSADQTTALVSRQAQIAQLLQCAESVGILKTVLDFSIQWARDRHSFGRPLASYQALKHRYADMKIWFEACRATTAAAAAAVSARSSEAELLVGVASSYVGEHAPVLVQHCVQMHGGIGVTWEHDLHLFLRRVTVNRAMFGTPEEHDLRVYELSEKVGSAS